MNLVTVARLQRNPTVKQEIIYRGFENTIPVRFMTYPISQAADITAFEQTFAKLLLKKRFVKALNHKVNA